MIIYVLKNRLHTALTKELPGWKSHIKLAPIERLQSIKNQIKNADSKQSAVLLILFKENDTLKILVILRSEYDGVHSGQVSFPGGQKEKYDNDLKETALRETFEEIGIKINPDAILGNLSDLYIPNSNFMVTPYVAYVDSPLGHFIPDPKEVQQIHKIALNELLEEKSIQISEVLASNNYTLKAPCFCIDNLKIWGATAMILNELLDIIKSNNLGEIEAKKMRNKN